MKRPNVKTMLGRCKSRLRTRSENALTGDSRTTLHYAIYHIREAQKLVRRFTKATGKNP